MAPKKKKPNDDNERMWWTCTLIVIIPLVEVAFEILKMTTTMSAHSLLSSPWCRQHLRYKKWWQQWGHVHCHHPPSAIMQFKEKGWQPRAHVVVIGPLEVAPKMKKKMTTTSCAFVHPPPRGNIWDEEKDDDDDELHSSSSSC